MAPVPDSDIGFEVTDSTVNANKAIDDVIKAEDNIAPQTVRKKKNLKLLM